MICFSNTPSLKGFAWLAGFKSVTLIQVTVILLPFFIFLTHSLFYFFILLYLFFFLKNFKYLFYTQSKQESENPRLLFPPQISPVVRAGQVQGQEMELSLRTQVSSRGAAPWHPVLPPGSVWFHTGSGWVLSNHLLTTWQNEHCVLLVGDNSLHTLFQDGGTVGKGSNNPKWIPWGSASREWLAAWSSARNAESGGLWLEPLKSPLNTYCVGTRRMVWVRAHSIRNTLFWSTPAVEPRIYQKRE